MKRKDKSAKGSFALVILRNVIILVLIGFLCFVGYNQTVELVRNSDYFRVRQILYDQPSEFIKTTKLSNLKNKNLLDIDLAALHKQLQRQYPEISQLQIYKRFPDKIVIIARKRVPFAKAQVKNRSVILDEEGIVLSTVGDTPGLPLITGAGLSRVEAMTGSPVASAELQTALKVMKTFRESSLSSRNHIGKVNVDNLSQVYFYLVEDELPGPSGILPLPTVKKRDDLKIIVDGANLAHKMRMLALVMSQPNLELVDVQYIDLRFKQPILGKKESK